jgi:fructose-bisphosphate aldolase, class II
LHSAEEKVRIVIARLRGEDSIAELCRREGIKIILNADYTHLIARAEEAATAGFDEIIFDGSANPVEQNVELTEAIKTIDPTIVLEGEIGYIGTSSSIPEKLLEEPGALTTSDEAREFVEATGVDVLASAVGNMRGMLQSIDPTFPSGQKKGLIRASTPGFIVQESPL